MLAQLHIPILKTVKYKLTKTLSHPSKSHVNFFLLKLTSLYTFIMFLIWIMTLFTDDQWIFTGLYRNMLPVIFVPVLLFILIGTINRQWVFIACLSPMIGSFGVEYLPLNFNALPPILDEQNFTILTYNLYGIDRDLSATLRLIEEADVDIVALQEMSVDAAELFAVMLADQYPYQALHPQPEMILGHGILSRFPIIEDEVVYVNQRPSFQRAEIMIEERLVTLFNVHTKPPTIGFGFHFNPQPRTTIIGALLDIALQEENPVIMVGDFNMTQSADDYYRITRHFTDLHRRVGRGLGLTYPDTTHLNSIQRFLSPLSRLDYIFHSEQIGSLRIRVWSHSGGSDHRPVWGLLHLPY